MSEPNQTQQAHEKAQSRQRINRNARTISVFTLLSRILGAVRDVVMVHIFGASAIYDAFIIALTIPNVLRRLTAEGSLAMVFVPIYTDIKQKRGLKDAQAFAQKVISLVIIACTLLTALGIYFSEEIVFLFASGFSENTEKFELTVYLTQIMFPYLIFISLVALAMGILNSEQRFAAPAAAPILLNVCIIIATLFFTRFFDSPIEAAAWGVFIAGIAQLLLQIPFLLQLQQPLIPKAFWQDEDIKRLLQLMAPTLFGVAVYQINIIVLRNIASDLPDGHVTYYNIASRLQELIVGVFAFSYATASLPEFSKQSSREDWQAAFSTLHDTTSWALFFVLPASAGFIAFALPVVSMLFLHGAFTWEDTLISAQALQWITLGIPALTLIRILVAIFFAMNDTRSPVLASALSVLVTGLAGWYLAQYFQVNGLMIALTLGAWFQVLALLFMLKLKSFNTLPWFPKNESLKYLACSCFIALLVYFSIPLASWETGPFQWINWFYFIGIMFSSLCAYVFILVLLKDKNALAFSHSLRNRLKR